jgi:hypothetical protein
MVHVHTVTEVVGGVFVRFRAPRFTAGIELKTICEIDLYLENIAFNIVLWT